MIKLELVLMNVGMVLAIVGGIAFLAIALQHASNTAVIAGMVAWGCGSAATIYSAGRSAIKKIKKQAASQAD